MYGCMHACIYMNHPLFLYFHLSYHLNRPLYHSSICGATCVCLPRPSHLLSPSCPYLFPFLFLPHCLSCLVLSCLESNRIDTVWYNVAWCGGGIAWCGMVWYGMVWCSVSWYGVACHASLPLPIVLPPIVSVIVASLLPSFLLDRASCPSIIPSFLSITL